MCVWVPITAVTRPSSQVAMATFSLVASAWKSTTTTGAAARASSPSSPTTSLDDREPAAGSLRAGVRRPDHPLAGGEVRRDPAAAVGVVTERDHVRAGSEQLVGQLRRDPGAVGRVLAVDDRKVSVVALAQRA